MSAPYLIPFNHQPVATGATSSTYTVPSGKYARVTVTLNATVFMNASSSNGLGNIAADGPSAADSVVVSVWAVAGDAISFSSSVPSGTSAAGSGSTVGFITGSTTSSALLNGTTFASARASSTFHSANLALNTVTVTGNTLGSLYYEEFNVIS